MKVGADPKQVAALAILLPVAGYLVYTNILSGGGGGDTAPRPGSSTPARPPSKLAGALEMEQNDAAARPAAPAATPARPTGARRGGIIGSQEWVPRVGARRPEDRADPAKTDPTLRLDLLAKLQNVTGTGGERSLFDFSSAPIKVPDVKVPLGGKNGKKDAAETAKAEPPKTEEPKPAADIKPSEPPPTPIPLKFYGFVTGSGGKRAFFRLGEDDIFMASEGQMVQARYKIVRIGINSAVVEDTRQKNYQQTLPLEEIPAQSGA
jgi:hypothetical protein